MIHDTEQTENTMLPRKQHSDVKVRADAALVETNYVDTTTIHENHGGQETQVDVHLDTAHLAMNGVDTTTMPDKHNEPVAKKGEDIDLLAFESYRSDFGHLLPPLTYKFPRNYRVTVLRGYEVGQAVQRMRNSKSLSDGRKNQLDSMGFVWDTDTYEKELYDVALQTFYNEQGHFNVPERFIFPGNHDDPKLRLFQLGTIHRSRFLSNTQVAAMVNPDNKCETCLPWWLIRC